MKPVLSSIPLMPGPGPRVNPIRACLSACQPPENCRRSAASAQAGQCQPQMLLCSRFPQKYRPPSNGWIRLRCRQTSIRTGTSGCGSMRFLPPIRPFPSLAYEPGPIPHQVGIQKPVGGPEEPGLRCRATSQPGRPGTGCNPASAPGNAGSQRTLKARPDFASPVGCVATPSTEGGPAAAAGGATANS